MTRTRLEQAKVTGVPRYFTGEPCARGHLAERFTSNRTCVECAKLSRNKWMQTNYNAHKAAGREWVQANQDQRLARQRTNRNNKPHLHRTSAQKARNASTGQLRQVCTHTASRLSLGSLTHSRLSLLSYNAAEWVCHLENTLPTGMTFQEARDYGYHVDHIIPISYIAETISDPEIQFKIAMDLRNLRMISARENLSKNNRLTFEARKLTKVLYSDYGVVT